MIQRARINCKGIGYTGLGAGPPTTRTVCSRDVEATRVGDGHTVGSKDTVDKRSRSSTSSGQCTRGADINRVPCAVKEGHCIVAGILRRDSNIKGHSSRLCTNGAAADRFHQEVIQGEFHCKGVRHSSFCPCTQTAGTVRGSNREVTRVRDRHAVGS